MAVALLNLKKQYENLREELEPVVLDVLNSAYHVLGPRVKEFEEKSAAYLGAKHAIGCANGTDALYISMLALDIKPGDEVITTPFTFIATAEAITQAGAKAVFVDIDPETYNITAESIKDKITDKTKAIIVVHLYGQCCDMDSIMALAKEHDLKVVEDAAQAFGSAYYGRNGKQFAGAIGDIGIFSFYPTKNLGCAGDGGLLTTNSDEINERLRKIRVHGSNKRYYHDEMGVNSRLDEIQAAILLVKLKHITEWNKHREKIAKLYDQELSKLPGITVPKRSSNEELAHIYHQYTIAIDESAGISRDELRDKLKEQEIGSEVYYPVPLHMQKLYEDLGHKPEDFPASYKASKEILCLPIYAELTEDEAKTVIEAVSQILTNTKQVQAV